MTRITKSSSAFVCRHLALQHFPQVGVGGGISNLFSPTVTSAALVTNAFGSTPGPPQTLAQCLQTHPGRARQMECTAESSCTLTPPWLPSSAHFSAAVFVVHVSIYSISGIIALPQASVHYYKWQDLATKSYGNSFCIRNLRERLVEFEAMGSG